MLRDRRAYSSAFWAIFIGLVVVPVFALAFDVDRYLYARQEVGKAADAAAVAPSWRSTSALSVTAASCIPQGPLIPGRSLTPT